MLEQKIQEIVSKYVDEEIAVDVFQEQFAGLYFAARKNPADRAAARLCNEIVGPIAEFGRGVGGEELLRQRLRPFAAAESQTLADLTGRKTSNLSRTLKTMERYGIVKLERQRRGRVIARAPYQSVTVDLSL